jgi:diamine N-acetyltransferase
MRRRTAASVASPSSRCVTARKRGYEEITVLWDPAENGPERFYLRVGFRKTGELFGETVGTLKV